MLAVFYLHLITYSQATTTEGMCSMFRRRIKIVLAYPLYGRKLWKVPPDNPLIKPQPYPDFYDTLWYVRRLREWVNGDRPEPPDLPWFTKKAHDSLLGDKGKRNVSVWLATFDQTITRLEEIEYDLQVGGLLDAEDITNLKLASARLWMGLACWFTTSSS